MLPKHHQTEVLNSKVLWNLRHPELARDRPSTPCFSSCKENLQVQTLLRCSSLRAGGEVPAGGPTKHTRCLGDSSPPSPQPGPLLSSDSCPMRAAALSEGWITHTHTHKWEHLGEPRVPATQRQPGSAWLGPGLGRVAGGGEVVVCFYKHLPSERGIPGEHHSRCQGCSRRAALPLPPQSGCGALGAPRSSSCTKLPLALEVVFIRDQELRELLSHEVQNPFHGGLAMVVRGGSVCSIAVSESKGGNPGTELSELQAKLHRRAGGLLGMFREVFFGWGGRALQGCSLAQFLTLVFQNKQKQVQKQQDRPCEGAAAYCPPDLQSLGIQPQGKAEPIRCIPSESPLWSVDLLQL